MKRSRKTAQNELGVAVQQRESDQQIFPVPDPKTSFFTSRALSADIESTVAVDFRALAIAGRNTIFDMTLPDDMFLDVASMKVSFKGTIRARKRDGTKEDIPAAGETEVKPVTQSTTFHIVTAPANVGAKYSVELREEELVDYKRALYKGVTLTPAPLFPLVIWKNVTVAIGGTQLNNSSKDLFYMQVYLRTLLESTREPTRAQLKRSLCVLDTSSSVIPGDTNGGLTERFRLAGNSTSCLYIMPLLVDGLAGFRQGSLLPGGTNLRVTFEMGDSRHSMTGHSSTNESFADKEYFVDVEDMQLHGRAYRLAAPVYNNFWSRLGRQELQFDYPAHIMDYIIIQKNNTTFRFQIPSSPCLPEKWVFCLMKTDQFAGRYESNTFWLPPHDLNQVDVQLSDGSKKLELKFDFTSEHYNAAYFHFLEENNKDILQDTVPLVPPEMYKIGRYMFCLDLTRNHSYAKNNAIRSIPQAASCEIVLHFSTALVKELILVHMSYREQTLFLNKELRAAIFKPPFRFVVVGPTDVGKTRFISTYLRLLDTVHGPGYFSKVRYYYGAWNQRFGELLASVPEIEFVSGAPTEELRSRVRDDDEREREPELWILDDLAHLLTERHTILDRLFTQLSHHQRISVILTSQVLYLPSGTNLLKLITANSTALLLFRNFKDDKALKLLCSQIFSDRPISFLSDALKILHKQLPSEPLAVALSSHFPEENLRVCAGILPSPERPSFRVYLPSR